MGRASQCEGYAHDGHRARMAGMPTTAAWPGIVGIPMVRLIVAEDSLIVREGRRQLLSRDPRLACDDEAPDVVVTDIRMPPTNTDEGIRLAMELRDSHPETGVVVLSQYSDPRYALALLQRGSDRRAYLLKERVHNRAELTAAIHAVAAGGAVIDPKN